MRVKGTICIEGAQLPKELNTLFAGLHINYEADFSLDEAKGMYDLAKNSHELIDSLAEGARKVFKYQQEFKDQMPKHDFSKTEAPASEVDPDIAAAMAELEKNS